MAQFLSEKLKDEPANEVRRDKCVGLLAAHLFLISGHRKGVLLGLTADELSNPEVVGNRLVVNVRFFKDIYTCCFYSWTLTF